MFNGWELALQGLIVGSYENNPTVLPAHPLSFLYFLKQGKTIMANEILADDSGEALANEMGAAFDNPAETDFGFAEARRETGYANFGFDPVKAAAMRAADPSNRRPVEDDEEEDDEYDSDLEDGTDLEW